MQKGQKVDQWVKQRQKHCHHYNQSKFLEEDQCATKQEDSTSQCGDSAAKDWNTHGWYSICGFVMPAEVRRVNIVSRQVNHIVNWESDNDDSSDGFRHSELPAAQDHDGSDVSYDKYHCYYRIDRYDYVLSG